MTTFYAVKFKDGKYGAGDGKTSEDLAGATFYRTITGAMNSISWAQAVDGKPQVVEIDIHERKKAEPVPLRLIETTENHETDSRP